MVSFCGKSDFIPASVFDEIVKCLPIVSFEGVIVTVRGLLFLKRNNEPVKGKWWFPGGRIHKGESLEEALKREVKEETGLEVTSYRLINIYSRVFPERHDITIAYSCRCSKSKVILNEEHSEFFFAKEMPTDLHPYLEETVHDLGWIGQANVRLTKNFDEAVDHLLDEFDSL
jgi:ADP-ribose pyrophosphatase YjhB (NUDIX family)